MSLEVILLICFLFLTIIFTNYSTLVNGQVQPDNFITFGKSIFGVSIKHPVDWQVNDYDRNIRDDRVGYDLVASMCPKSILERPYQYSNTTSCPQGKEVLISIDKLPKNATLKEFLNYLEVSNKFVYTGYKPGNTSSTTLSGFPAIKSIFTYLGEHNGTDEIIRVLQVSTIYGNRIYTVSYFSPQLEFGDLMPTVQKMIESFKIMPMPVCNFVKDEYGGKCVLSDPSVQ